MSTLICKKDFNACRTPGMCSPHGGCQAEKSEWQAGYDEGRRMGTKHMYAEVDRLKSENEAQRQALRNVMTQIDGNIRETVRDCVNGHNDVQDIYGYCDTIEGLIDAVMSKEASHD